MVRDVTHDDWNSWIIIILVKVCHNRIVPSYFSICTRWELFCLEVWGTTVVLLHVVEKNSARSSQTACVHCLGRWCGCACPMAFCCTHCELFKARTGWLETASCVVDITGKNRKKGFLVFQHEANFYQICCGKCWPNWNVPTSDLGPESHRWC